MVNTKIDNLIVGSKVFVYSMNALRQYEIISFRISNHNGELRCDIEAEYTTRGGVAQRHKFPLDLFIRGIEAAQDMKISDIDQ